MCASWFVRFGLSWCPNVIWMPLPVVRTDRTGPLLLFFDRKGQFQRVAGVESMPSVEELGAAFTHSPQFVVRQDARLRSSILLGFETERVVELFRGPASAGCAFGVQRPDYVLHEQRIGGQSSRDAALTRVVDFPSAGDDSEEPFGNAKLGLDRVMGEVV